MDQGPLSGHSSEEAEIIFALINISAKYKLTKIICNKVKSLKSVLIRQPEGKNLDSRDIPDPTSFVEYDFWICLPPNMFVVKKKCYSIVFIYSFIKKFAKISYSFIYSLKKMLLYRIHLFIH